MTRESITAQSLRLGYKSGRKESPIHENISFTLSEGELTVLLGPNGIGKSTLLRTMAGLQKALGGSLSVGGSDINSLTKKELAKRIGLVLTEKTNTGGLTARELVSLGRQPHTGFWGKLSGHDIEIVTEALTNIGLSGKSEKLMCELSDGEKQKAMIAKALVQECPIILLDEPTAYLDVTGRIETMALLHGIASSKGKAILVTSHDVEQALLWADNIWILTKDGFSCGRTEEMIISGRISKLYEGKNISFDMKNCSFTYRNPYAIPVSIETDDPSLSLLCERFLIRNGYYPSDNAPRKIRIDDNGRISFFQP